MAKMDVILPDDVMKQFEEIYQNTDEIFGEMTKAGAQAVLEDVKQKCPNKDLVKYFRLSKTYKTPSDGGINTKVYAVGYLPFSDPNRKYFSRRAKGTLYHTDKGVPVDFLLKLYEYGRSTAPFPKSPFFRACFSNAKITEEMLKAQILASNGMLTDEDFHPVEDLGRNPFE